MSEGPEPRWKVDYAHARRFDPEIEYVVMTYLGLQFFRVMPTESGGEADQKFGRDYQLIRTNEGFLASRIRGLNGGRKHLEYFDMAIRGETEEHKIRRGDCPPRYLYCWAHPELPGKFARWMLIDMEPVRKHRLLDLADRRPDPYHAGRTYLLIPIEDLKRTQAILKASWPWYDDQGACVL